MLQYVSDFDRNGLFYWLGTNGGLLPDWSNPSKYGLVHVTSSDGPQLPFGTVHDILSRDSSARNCHTNNKADSWFAVDLGLWLVPTAYTLRHARGYSKSALRNWVLEASKDGKSWTVLRNHVKDEALDAPGSTATWQLEAPADDQGWRHVRIRLTGPNQGGSSNYVSLSGLELYGRVMAVEPELEIPTDGSAPARADLSQIRLLPGMRVARGPDWKWNNQDGDPPGSKLFFFF